MSNNITLAKKYVPYLDEVYAQSSVTAVLESDHSLARAGANANEIIIPSMTLDGLADYDRAEGYVNGDVGLTWKTEQFNYERGRMFSVDSMDNEETQNIAFGRLAGEFIRTKVVPELDAFRFATYASSENVTKVSADITDGAKAVDAIRRAVSAMDEAEVPSERRILFVTPAVRGMIEDMDTTKSRAVLAGFEKIVTVPQTRFYSSVRLLDGVSVGEKEGGYTKGDDALNIQFMIVQRDAVMQFTKHAVPKIITPENNPDADAWKYGYRTYSMCCVLDGKGSGIYVQTEAE